MAPCTACLGDLKCWVCTGNGLIDVRNEDRLEPCHRCFGSGKCFMCQEIAVADIQQPPPLLRVGRFKRRLREAT